MNEFLEIGEIIEVFSEPIKVSSPVTTTGGSPSAGPGGPNSNTTKQILYVVGAIGVGLLIYYLYKKYQDENTPTRNKP
jgi:hypothetical protein